MAVTMLDADLDERPDLGPAKAVAAGLIATALAANAWLIHMGYGALTDLARTPAGTAVRRYFDGHCDQRLVVDLFSIVGARIPRRFP